MSHLPKRRDKEKCEFALELRESKGQIEQTFRGHTNVLIDSIRSAIERNSFEEENEQKQDGESLSNTKERRKANCVRL